MPLLKHHDENIARESLFYLLDRWYTPLFHQPDSGERPDKFELNQVKTAFLKLFPDYEKTFTSIDGSGPYYGNVGLKVFFEMIEFLG